MQLPLPVLNYIASIKILSNREDQLCCSLASGNYFNKKFLYQDIWEGNFNISSATSFNWSSIWTCHCPPKIHFFLWLVAWNNLPTRATLHARNVIESLTMALAYSAILLQRTPLHVLRDCTGASEVWHKSTTTATFFSFDLDDQLSTNLDSSSNYQGIPWPTVFAFTTWKIWLRRNLWVLSNRNIPLPRFLHQTHQLINEFYWALTPNSNITNTTNRSDPFEPSPNHASTLIADASFNANSHSVVMPGLCFDYLGTLQGGFVWQIMTLDANVPEIY